MITRSLSLAGGLAGALASAQFPEFSQQYVQRLGGAVDALEQIVTDFDTSARAEGLSRTEALARLEGDAFLERRRADMTRTFDRHARLASDLDRLENHGPFMRAYNVRSLTDPEIARAALRAFEPALPITSAGLMFAATGFLAGLGATRFVLGLLAAPFVRRRAA